MEKLNFYTLLRHHGYGDFYNFNKYNINAIKKDELIRNSLTRFNHLYKVWLDLATVQNHKNELSKIIPDIIKNNSKSTIKF